MPPPQAALAARNLRGAARTSHLTTRTATQRFFSGSALQHKGKGPSALPPRPTLADADVTHVYLKGSGPGGQKINKTSSAAQLTHGPTGIVVKSQATRSRSQNYTIARRILAEKVELREKGPESRLMQRQARDHRKKASKAKKARRKYRALNGAGAAEGDQEEEDDDDAVEGQGEREASERAGVDDPAVAMRPRETLEGRAATNGETPSRREVKGNAPG